MLQSSVGSLTIVNAHGNAVPAVFWRGKPLARVLSVTSFNNPPAPAKVTIRVVAPAKVSPALSPEDQLALVALYDDMTAAGIHVLKV